MIRQPSLLHESWRDTGGRNPIQPWESVHVCSSCGHVINLAELDMQAIATGIVTCPSCACQGRSR